MYKKASLFAITMAIIASTPLIISALANSGLFVNAAVNPSTQCIVTIAGNQYDLTALSQTHSGPKGNSLNGGTGYFKCGTDMTASYVGQHGNNVSRLNSYLLSAPTQTTTPTNTPVTPGVNTTTAPIPQTNLTQSTTCIDEDNDDQDDVNEIDDCDNNKEHEQDAEHDDDKVENTLKIEHKENKKFEVKHQQEKDDDDD